uniref:Uncharacterized protein n=1 Tax=Salix viminalis TaxID=40686 RepID=A0A6N2KGN9_SALVM
MQRSGQLHGLKVLDLSRTNIDSLPDSVSDLEGLTSLLLKGCRRLSSVPSLKKLSALKRLDLLYICSSNRCDPNTKNI